MLVFYKHKNVILVIIKVENFLNLINTKQGVTNEVAKKKIYQLSFVDYYNFV